MKSVLSAAIFMGCAIVGDAAVAADKVTELPGKHLPSPFIILYLIYLNEKIKKDTLALYHPHTTGFKLQTTNVQLKILILF